MWIDSRGVTHTVALPDPAAAMAPEAVSSLDALSGDDRARVLDELDSWYWNEYVAGPQRTEIAAAKLAPEGAPLPDGYITTRVRNAEEALDWVRNTEPAWRIDVLEAVQDYLEAKQHQD